MEKDIFPYWPKPARSFKWKEVILDPLVPRPHPAYRILVPTYKQESRTSSRKRSSQISDCPRHLHDTPVLIPQAHDSLHHLRNVLVRARPMGRPVHGCSSSSRSIVQYNGNGMAETSGDTLEVGVILWTLTTRVHECAMLTSDPM